MEKKRFYDLHKNSFSLWGCVQKDGILIRCPKCEKQAILKLKSDGYVAQCLNCTNVWTPHTDRLKLKYAKGICRKCGRWCNIKTELKPNENYGHIFRKCPYCGENQSFELDSSDGIIISPYDFTENLYLKASFRGHEVWAYNYDHLNYLIKYVEAELRQPPQKHFFNSKQSDCLPKFIKLAKNRNDILKVLYKLREV